MSNTNSMTGWDNKILTAGDLAMATNYNPSKVFAELTAWNVDSLRGQFEQYNFTSVGHIQDLEMDHSIGDIKQIIVDNCNVWVINTDAIKTPKLKFTWLDVNNMTIFSNMLWLDLVSVTGTPVTAHPQLVKAWDWAKNVFIAFDNQNGDGSAITPTTVTNGWTAITSTDYTVWTDSLGRYWIIIKTSYTGVLTTDLLITFDYSPNPYVLSGYSIWRGALPMGLYRFRSCVQTSKAWWTTVKTRNTIYLVKFSISSDMVEAYINTDRKELEGSKLELTGQIGWFYLKVKETLA